MNLWIYYCRILFSSWKISVAVMNRMLQAKRAVLWRFSCLSVVSNKCEITHRQWCNFKCTYTCISNVCMYVCVWAGFICMYVCVYGLNIYVCMYVCVDIIYKMLVVIYMHVMSCWNNARTYRHVLGASQFTSPFLPHSLTTSYSLNNYCHTFKHVHNTHTYMYTVLGTRFSLQKNIIEITYTAL